MLIASERVTNENRIRARSVECPIGLIGNLEWGQFDARIKL
jgi:hypothetical protein